MIARLGSGWQTITADLALILFLVTAQTSFSATSPIADPLPANNVEVESTLVRPDRLLSDGFE